MAKSAENRSHTARLVKKYRREVKLSNCNYLLKRVTFGRVGKKDPWDCGRANCGVCRDTWESRKKARQEARAVERQEMEDL